jgi:hypothetical protein
MGYWSDKRQRNGENRPRPFGFHPSAQRSRSGSPGLWQNPGVPGDRTWSLEWKFGHTLFSPSTLEPPKPSGSAASGRIFARNAIHPGSVNRP